MILTSIKEDKDLKVCDEQGVNGYIMKPENYEEFFKSAKKIGLNWVLINQPLE